MPGVDGLTTFISDALGETMEVEQMLRPSVGIARSLEHVIHSEDIDRITALRDFMRRQSSGGVLNSILPSRLPPYQWSVIVNECRLIHTGLLIFPNQIDAFLKLLPGHGLIPSTVIPSVVVRDRLARQHKVDPASLPVSITHASIVGNESRDLELFLVPSEAIGQHARLADERFTNRQTHFAFAVDRTDQTTLRAVHSMLTFQGALSCDGGGVNEHENCTVFYFMRPGRVGRWPRRIELMIGGDHSELLAIHLAASQALQPQGTTNSHPEVASGDR